MKMPILTKQIQPALAIIWGLMVGFVMQPGAFQSAQPVPPTPTSEPTPRPFSDLPGVWLVLVEFTRSDPPNVVDVQQLEIGRITATVGGGYVAQIISVDGEVLYQIDFDVIFIFGDPPVNVESTIKTILLPSVEGQYAIRILSDNGEAIYLLEMDN